MLGAAWLLAVIGGLALVVYGFGPVLQARQQSILTRAERQHLARAANEVGGLGGVTTPVKAPSPGSPLGILEIGAIRLQQVVVEGGTSTQTQKGPGHVTGTAGLGQPGNSVVVGRAHAFGGPFRDLGRLRPGDQILLSTSQGQSVYGVDSVRDVPLRRAEAGATAEADASSRRDGDDTIDTVYGATKEDRLTLVTSASAVPSNRSRATVVVAALQGLPFAPTVQNGRGDTGLGMDGDRGAAAATVLAMSLFGATMSASIFLYHRGRSVTAYMLTIGPITATIVIAGETVSRMFPGWM